jgi:hypothetical protein
MGAGRRVLRLATKEVANMASSRSSWARWAVAAVALVSALGVAVLALASTARADPWWAETTQTSVVAGDSAVPDALDRYLGNQQRPTVQVILPAAPAESGFQFDWANIAIGVGIALAAAFVVTSAFVVARHGGHGGPGRPVAHG